MQNIHTFQEKEDDYEKTIGILSTEKEFLLDEKEVLENKKEEIITKAQKRESELEEIISSLEEDKEILKKEAAAAEAEHTTLIREKESLKREFAAQGAELETVRETVHKQDKLLEEQKIIIKEQEKYTGSLEKELELARKKASGISEFRTEIASLTEEKERLKDKNNSLKESLKAREDELDEIEAIFQGTIQRELYLALKEEFKDDLEKWDAEIVPETLIIRFNDLNYKFGIGESEPAPVFREILSDFFPRYVKLLSRSQFTDKIEEVRIEGHASSDWAMVSELESYLNNMELSQERALRTFYYCLTLPESVERFDWLKNRATASGLSFSRLITKEVDIDGETEYVEDKERSRRVEFRAVTCLDRVIELILGMNRNKES